MGALAVTLGFATLPCSILLSIWLVWYALFRRSRVAMCGILTYVTHIAMDKSFERGAKPREWVKGHALCRWFADYFPVELRKMNAGTEFSSDNVYLFGYHPHGIISV